MKAVRLVVCLTALVAVGCSKKQVDLVNGVPPVATSLAGVEETLSTLASLPPGERGAYLERTWPHLEEDVVYYLRRIGKLPLYGTPVTRVEFLYGSMDYAVAESGDGQRRQGFFSNQLVAVVYPQGREPIPVIVKCLNGTFMLPEDLRQHLQMVGDHAPEERFTIGPREGLIHHVDFPTAIDMAQQFNLPLYRGRIIDDKFRITPDEARHLESTTDRLQVTVYVVEGDQFNLVSMTFTPSPRRGGGARAGRS